MALSCLFAAIASAQTPYPGCPNVSATPADGNLTVENDTVVLDCGETCTQLDASFLATGATTDYNVESITYNPPFSFTGGTRLFVGEDDVYSDAINLPFNFCFYGNTYNQIAVGANGVVTFDMSWAGNFNCYSIDNPIPNANNAACALTENGNMPHNSIYGAFHDLDPRVGGSNINYSVIGEFPCRTFVVNWANVGHFDCTNLRTTQQIVIYENTNVVEVYIQDKPACNSWNGGRAVIGIQNNNGTAAVAPPGRNTSRWTASNEAWRFTPDGAPNFELSWLDENGNPISTNTSITVCPDDPENPQPVNRTVQVVYTLCGNNDITVSQDIVVVPRPEFNAEVSTQDVLCNGACDGEATITIPDGVGPFNAMWPDGIAGLSRGGLCSGTYSVEVTDANGCSQNVAVTIEEPSPLSLSFTTIDAPCNGERGGLIPIVGGGTAPYSLLWSDGATTDTISRLAGSYSVEITDANNCTISGEAEITEPEPLVVDTNSTQDLSCPEARNGVIDATATGGTPPYEYSINGVDFFTSGNFSNLDSGNYELTVRDANKCLDQNIYRLETDSVSVTAPEDIAICEGEEITLTATGSFVTVSWNNGITDGVPFTPSHLGDLEYEVTARNALGCEARDQVVVTVNEVKDPTITPVGPFCTNNEDVQIEVAESGGVWGGPVSPTGVFSPSATGSGTHEITYTFEGPCRTADTLLVGVNDQFEAEIDPAGPFCEGDARFTLTSATPGGEWYGPGIANRSSSVFDPRLAGPGMHWVYHLIDNECGDLDSLEITVTQAVVANIAQQPGICHDNTGTQLSATPADGSWETSSYLNDAGVFTPNGNIGPGSYPVVYVPNAGCNIPDTALITVFDTLVATPDTFLLDCKGDADAVLNTQTSGGSGTGYSYDWNPGGANLGASRNGLSEGRYTVDISCSAGCQAQVQHEVIAPDALQLTQPSTTDSVSCNAGTDGVITVFPSGGTPDAAGNYNLALVPNAGMVSGNQISSVPAGSYTITVSDENGCSVTDNVVVQEPNPISVSTQIGSAHCQQSDGSIRIISIVGGSGGYQMNWQGYSQTNDLTNIPSGTYTLEITDAKGCTHTEDFVVPEVAGPTVTLTATDVSCRDSTDGAISSAVVNGSTPFSYLWSEGSTTPDISGVPAGEYSLVVTDQFGCEAEATAEVEQPTQLNLQKISDEVLCVGQSALKNFQVSGGNPGGYTFTLNGETTVNSFSTDTAGDYTIQAFDSKGCPSEKRSFSIDYRDSLRVTVDFPDSICPGVIWTLQASASGGLESFDYNWSTGQSGAEVDIPTQATNTGETVTLVVSDNCSTPFDTTLETHFYTVPKLADVVTPTSACVPFSIRMDVSGFPIRSQQWIDHNGAVISEDAVAEYEYTKAGSYPLYFEGETNQGCVVRDTLSVQANPLPFATLRQAPNTLDVVNRTGLYTVVNFNHVNRIYWRAFSALDSTILGQQESTQFAYFDFPADTGNYVVEAILESEFLCRDTLYKAVRVGPAETHFVPTAFSPDGDGVNDVFAMASAYFNVENFKISIYNRWGEEVYAAEGKDFAWDGTYRGEKVPVGAYAFFITYNLNGSIQREYGTILVLD